MSTTTKSQTAKTHTEETTEIVGGKIHLRKGGRGKPLLVLHDDVGSPGWLPFHEQLASRFTVYAPSLPGFDQSERPEWMRDVRDVAIVQIGLLNALGLDRLHVVGLGLGGWVAAEMATMCQHRFDRMVLVGAVGVQPTEGEILDQFLVSGEEYARLGFHDESKFEETFGAKPDLDQQEAWEINREMTARIAWKPYMFNQTLPRLIGGVETPTLLVWGKEDKVAPLSCSQRYAEGLPNSRLELLDGSGHCVDVEKPKELASLIADFIPD